MLNFIQKFNFLDMLLPHYEDDVVYAYKSGEFIIEVTFDDVKKLKLKFQECTHQTFHPIPGINILSEPIDFFGLEPACVYIIEGTKILNDYHHYSTETGLPFDSQYYFCRFDSHNTGFHIIASSFSHTIEE